MTYAPAEPATGARRHAWIAVGGFLGAFVLAIALHTAWDSQESLIGTAIVAVVEPRRAGLDRAPHRPPPPPLSAPLPGGGLLPFVVVSFAANSLVTRFVVAARPARAPGCSARRASRRARPC